MLYYKYILYIVLQKNMKKIKNSNLFSIIIILFTLLIYILISAFSYVNAVFNNISNNVFRLHVIAHSDSTEDQNLKYLVRDEIISYMNTICNNATDKTEAMKIASEHQETFYKIAKQVIIDNGYDYDVKIEIGNFNFPTKNYGDITLPAGNYDALKIEIGEAKGQNWWCVMFPPLCFVDVTSGIVPEESKDIIQNNLSSEEYVLISNNEDLDVKFKFKLVEFFKSL